jgi:hypothetical protein
MEKKKNPHAQALRKLAGSKPGKARARNLTAEQLSAIGRMGGLVGGPARAKKLTRAKLREIARKAIAARWAKVKAKRHEEGDIHFQQTGPEKPGKAEASG